MSAILQSFLSFGNALLGAFLVVFFAGLLTVFLEVAVLVPVLAVAFLLDAGLRHFCVVLFFVAGIKILS